MRVTISLFISRIAVELGNINSPLSVPLLPNFVTNFPHSSNTWVLWLVESQTISNPAFLTYRERGWLNSPSLVPFSKFTKVSLRIKRFNEMITTVSDTPTSTNGHLSTTTIFFRGNVYTFTVISASTTNVSLQWSLFSVAKVSVADLSFNCIRYWLCKIQS